MSSMHNKSKSARFIPRTLALTALIVGGWSLGQLFLDEAPPQLPAIPETGALSSRSVTPGPVEFDAMLKNLSSGLCLDVANFSTDNNKSVQQWGCNNTTNQRVWLDSVAGTDKYRLRVEHSGKCLEPSSNQSGAELRQWVCHNGTFERPNVTANVQHWTVKALDGNRFSIVSAYSNMALSSSGSSLGSLLKLHTWSGSNNQKFEFLSRNDHNTNPAEVGSWGEFISWPHIPVHAAVTPANTVVTWSSNEVDDYPQTTGNKYSWSSVYDPASDTFLETNNPSHDMFCAGTTLLEDGSLLATGGNPRASEASHFDPQSNSWSLRAYMSQQRWYGTNVVTGNGDVFSTFAKGAQEVPELYSTSNNSWKRLPGADMSVLRNEQDQGNALRVNASAELQWYAFMHTAPDGRIFQSGPTKTMHWYSTDGQGTVSAAGKRLGEERSRQFGSAVMYDVGKLLLTGGSDPTVQNETSSNGRLVGTGASDSAMTIDISGATPVVSAAPAMNSRRSNHNAVVLPNGEVYIAGGTEWGLLFDDQYSAMWPEIWNPQTRQWRSVAALSTPRNYHSWALLLQDARVLVGGGGLCGDCSVNHPDAQIFTPPYLYSANGALVERPEILQGSSQSKVGGLLSFSTSKAVEKINMVRLSSVTHSINNDQRFISLNVEDLGANVYVARLSSNANVMVPGMYWVFAIDAAGTPSTGHVLQVQSVDGFEGSILASALPSGTLKAKVGAPVRLQLEPDGFDNGDLMYSSINLPQGLSLDEEMGVISGRAEQAGTGSFVVSLSDGEKQATERADYEILAADVDTGGGEGGSGEPTDGGQIGGGGGAISWISLLSFLLLIIFRSRAFSVKKLQDRRSQAVHQNLTLSLRN